MSSYKLISFVVVSCCTYLLEIVLLLYLLCMTCSSKLDQVSRWGTTYYSYCLEFVDRTLYGLHCTAYTVRSTLFGLHCTAYTVRHTR